MMAAVVGMSINFEDLMNVVLLLWLVCALIGVATIIWNYESFSEMVDTCLENPRYLAFAPRDLWVFFSVLVVMATSPYLIGYWAFYRLRAYFSHTTWCYSISTSDVDDVELVIKGPTVEDAFQNFVITTNAEVDLEIGAGDDY